MTTGFFQFFNAKTQSNASKKARAGRDRSPLKPRRLLTETLEERQLLAVDAFGASALLATTAIANTYNISSSDYSIDAIKSAIQDAASKPGDDLIRIPAGSLSFSSASDTITVDYDADQFGSITIEAVSEDVTIDANGLGRVFTIKNGDLILNSINITGGSADYGGAIANAGSLTLKNVKLTDNTAIVSGGAIANKGVLAVQDSIITGNSAQEDGAAIYDGDFDWPVATGPEWVSDIPDQVGEKDGTITLNLKDFANDGDWTYGFTCSNPDAAIFSAEPTLVDGVLTMKFIGQDAYNSMLDLSAVDFTVTVSDGTTTDSRSFKVSHKSEAAFSISAVLSNMSYDDIDEEYYTEVREGKKIVKWGYCSDTIPAPEIVDINSSDLYVQIWASDHCFNDGESDVAWDSGDNYIISGYQLIIQLENASLVESHAVDDFGAKAYDIADLGDGKYVISVGYDAVNGAPFGYNDALMVDMLKIKATKPEQPVRVDVFQYSTVVTKSSVMRIHTVHTASGDEKVVENINPSQIFFSGSISGSTDPYNPRMGQPYDEASSAVEGETSSAIGDYALNTANSTYSTSISNSLIANNTATSGSGAVYVGTGKAAQIYNTTIADNLVGEAAVYVEGTALVANSIVALNSVAPFSGSVSGSNNLVDATVDGSVTYDPAKPLFEVDAYTLAVDSQAANIGSAEYALDIDGAALTKDLAGNDRISAIVDAGAYEYQGSAPEVPATLTVSDYVDSGKNPTLTWSASESVDGVDGYYVYCGDDLIATVTETSLANLAGLVTLVDDSSYTFKVSAFNLYGESARRTVDIDTTIAPVAPTGLEFGAYANGSATLTWTPVSNAVSYVVTLTNVDTGDESAFDASEASYTFTGLSDFTNYSATVTAVNSKGVAVSDPATLDTTVAPAVPTGLTATAYTGDNTSTLTWNAVDHADGYYVAQKDGDEWKFVTSTSDPTCLITDLADNSSYTYGVAAFAVKDGSPLASGYAEVAIITTIAPDAPTNLEWVGAYADHSATLQWAASEGAVGYRVASLQNGEWTVVGETTGVNYTFQGLIDNQELTFGVAAYSELGTQKLYSDYASIDLNTVVAPAVPTNVRFAEYTGGTSANLTWTASVGGATGYNVERLDGGDWILVGATPDTNFAVEVEENSFYTYRVVAFNTVGEATAFAAPSSNANLDTLVPPQGEITVVASDYDYATGAATLTWTNLDHASYYVVEQKTSDEAEYTIVDANVPAGTEATTTYSLADLLQHTTYQFRVTAYNAKGAGSVGVSDEFYTNAPPTKPVASYVYDSVSASATITFSSEYADKYIVTNADGAQLYEGSDGYYIATGLAENEIYPFYVVATNDVGASETTLVSVNTAAVPHAPTGLIAGEYADGAVILTWNDVDAETGYRVYVQNGTNWEQVGNELAANVTQAQVTGLSDYASYTFCVAAFNEVGESDKSVSVVVDTTVAPAAPTGLTFTFGSSATYQGDGKATFVWNAVDHASGYQIQQKGEDGTWTDVASITSASYNITGLDNYTTYDYRVAAYALRGTERLYSPYAEASLSTDWIPTAPLTLSVGEYDAASKTAVLTWNDVEAATNYKIEQNVGGVWTSVGTTSETTYTLDLADNTNYVFRVVATNEIGDGSSDIVEFFTAAAPAAPTVSGSYDSATHSATITFSSAYATSYTVTDDKGTPLYSGPNTSVVVEGLEENETYQYVVVASNDRGDSPATTYSLYTAAVPAAPTGLAFGEYADGSVDFSWNAVDAATGYRVYVLNGSTWDKVGNDLTTNAVTLTNLSDYNVYAYCVTAFNGEGESLQSAPATLDTTVTPDAPVVSVTYGGGDKYQGDGAATLIWDAVDHAEGYYVARKDGGKWTFLEKTNGLAFDVSRMENFSTYEYGVASYATRYGEDLVSEYASVSIDTTWIPEGEIALTVGAYDYVADTAPVSWTSVEHADGYRIDVTDADGNLTFTTTVVGGSYDVPLSDNEAYAIRVTAVNAVGDGSYDEKSVFTYAPPAAPTDAAFGEFVAETGKATITWTDVSFAEWYEVKTTIDGSEVSVQTDVPYYTVEGLVEDTEYTYYVRACNHIGETSVEGYSDWVEVTLDTHAATVPNAPSEFALVDYDEATVTARLVWKDNSRNEEQFIIQRSFDGETWTDVAYVAANSTSCAVSNLQRGVTYYYQIAASNQYGQSEWVSLEYAVPSGVPAAPTDVTFSEYDDENKVFNMSWTDNSTNELYFKVEYSTDGETWGGARTVSADETSVEWVNLTEGQTYQFRVSAWNSYGISDFATGSYQIPIDGKVTPAAPSGLVFGDYNFDTRTVSMSWTDNSSDESDSADVFVVEYSFDGQTWRSGGTTAGDVTSRVATGMIADREYYFRVCARNAAGDSDWTTGVFSATTTIAAPSAFVVGDYSDGTLKTSWSYDGTLSSDGGFIVQYSFDGDTWSRAGNTASDVSECVVSNVSPNRTYYFRVAAYDGAVYSDWTYGEAYTTPADAPTAPSNLTFSEIENKSVEISWTDNSKTETGFNVQYSIDGGETWLSAGNTSKDIAKKTFAQLRPGVTYQFRVRAFNYGSNGSSASDWTVGELVVPQSSNAPNAPTDVTINNYDAAEKTLVVNWVDNSNNEKGFRVQYSYSGADQWYVVGNLASNVTERFVTGLVSGRTYQFRVCAYNDEGASDWAYSDEFLAAGVSEGSGAILDDSDDDMFDLLSNTLVGAEAVDAYFANYFEEDV